ncbi:unnamed protein product [Periconia digitata]|uniref:AAA+ ATPase domain-containing protein n=1 Tax=Periconia digitata TaxID=1303443 RepID=A0A9W4UEB6_9PLEO|nr:unnamed protein product [Periconia digitata]
MADEKHEDPGLHQDVNETAESADLPDAGTEIKKSPSQLPELSSAFMDDIDGLKRRILELEALQAEASGEHVERQEKDSQTLAEIERYKRMESCLYNHRKEWEMSGGPGTWWGTTDATRRVVGIGEHGEYGEHEWTMHHPFLHQDHYYTRPNVFDADHDCNPPINKWPGGKDEYDRYDSIIDWGNRRDRLRKNFEWQMDRLFLDEELQMRRQGKFRASMKKKEPDAQVGDQKKEPMERRMAEADGQLADQSTDKKAASDHEDTDEDVESESSFGVAKLNWTEWSQFTQLRYLDEWEACVVDVLIGDPIIDDDATVNRLWFGYSGHRANKSSAKTRGQKPFDPMKPGQSPLPERIRIQSTILLRILSTIIGPEYGGYLGSEDAAAIIIRPFKALAFTEQALRHWCTALEKKLGKNSTFQDQIPAVDLSSADVESEQGTDWSKHSKSNADLDDNGTRNPADPLTINLETKTEAREQQTADLHQVADQLRVSDDEQTPTQGNVEISDVTTSSVALDHLKCLLKFIDSSVVAKREYLDGPQCRKVFFSDLWHLFRPGIEVIDREGKQAYKVIGVKSAKHRVTRAWERWSSDNPRNPQKQESPFSVKCVYIDFDGKNIGPVMKTFEFKRFDSEREITSFEIYPLRLHVPGPSEYSDVEWRHVQKYPIEERYRQKLILRGAKFLDAAGVKHMYYAGPTLEAKEEVESPVVVDFETAFTTRKDLPPPRAPVGGWRNREEAEIAEREHMQQQWKPVLITLIGSVVFEESDLTSSRTTDCQGDCCRNEYVHDDQFVDQKQSTDYVNSLLPNESNLDEQPPITIIPRPLKELQTGSSKSITCPESEMVIMSYRVFGFVLRSRKWAKLDLSYLNDVALPKFPPSTNTNVELNLKTVKQKDEDTSLTLNRLVLEKGHHSMIVSLIAQHFRDKRSTTGQREEFDLVKGKGKGLIILLHGAPGVGKTSTAEGVAEMFEKPLFQITCGDLGTTAAEVEVALESTFSLANKWDCILLLDEADVFLAERTKEDFKRNGLVAVFLRLMEYYSGILFLTTNRVGDFDEAFTSRIHVSLFYPELNEDKTVKVFKINMDMIEERFRRKQRVINIDRMEIGSFAGKYFAEYPNARWNGRQIRNACQTALALAEFEAQDGSLEDTENSDKPVTLTVEHFTIVRDAYLEFTKYMHNLYGTTSARRAKESRLRAVWVDENNNLIDAASMGGPRDKKNAFLRASQSQAPRPMGQTPQQSFQQQQQPQQPSYSPNFVGGYQQPDQQQQQQYQSQMPNQAFGGNQPQFANPPSGYPQRESYPVNQNRNNQSPGPYFLGSQPSMQHSASGSPFEQPLQHNDPNVHG